MILQELFASVLWFHPLAHLLNRMLNRVREELCDNHTISVVDRASYCEALLLLAGGRPALFPRGATSLWSARWSLEDRVRGILDEQRPTQTRMSKRAISATAILSLAICGMIAMPRLIAAQTSKVSLTSIEAEPSLRADSARGENLTDRVDVAPITRDLTQFSPPLETFGMKRAEYLPYRADIEQYRRSPSNFSSD